MDSDYWPVLPTSPSDLPIEVTDDMIVKPRWLRRHWQVVIVAIVVVIVVPLVWQKGEIKPRPAAAPLVPIAKDDKPPSNDLVYANTAILVLDHLKAPRSAEFTHVGHVDLLPGWQVDPHYAWRVKSAVDSQNALGVFLRSKFMAEVHLDKSTQKWSLQYLFLNDELVYATPEMQQTILNLSKMLEESERESERMKDRLN